MTNKEAFAQAQTLIAGGVNSPVRAFKSVGSEPVFIKKGDGAYIIDIEDKKYLDLVQSYGPCILGHADINVTNAIINAAKDGTSYGAPTLAESKLAQKVISLYPAIEQIRFVNSGTEATMSAIRLARAYSNRDGLIKFDGCYHGHADMLLVNAGSGLATFNTPSSSGVSKNAVKDTYTAKYNDIESVKEQITIAKSNGSEIGVIIIEPIAGNMGFVPAKKEFLEDLRKLCDELKIVLIFDEVMSGFRAALGGALEIYKVVPDMVCFGKVIGGGLPVGAYAAKKEIMQLLSPLGGVYQAGTLSGNPLAMAAGIANLEQLNDDIYKKCDKWAKNTINAMLDESKSAGVPFVAKNIGSMLGFFFNEKYPLNYDDAKTSDTAKFSRFHKIMLENGVNLAPSTYETAFICSKFEDKEFEIFINAFKKAIRA